MSTLEDPIMIEYGRNFLLLVDRQLRLLRVSLDCEPSFTEHCFVDVYFG